MHDLLATLVSMRTLSEDAAENERALDFIQAFVEQRGMHGKRYVFNGHGAYMAWSRPNNRKHQKVLLSGHVDVMHGSDQVFALHPEGDRLIGRGVHDMKSAIAAYLTVIDGLKDQLADYDFGLMITTDEEFGTSNGVNGVRDLLALGYRTDICVLPDGGRNWHVETVAKGYWRFVLKAKGVSAHGSRPWKAESASFKLLDALQELKTKFAGHGPTTDTLNIGKIEGGKAFNQVPDAMSAWAEIRLMSDESLQELQDFVQKLCQKFGLEAATVCMERPLKTDVEQPLIQEFRKCVKQVTGKESKPCISYAASDAIYFAPLGIPCIVTYPPGGDHHSESEWITPEAVRDFPMIIREYLDRVAKLSEAAK